MSYILNALRKSEQERLAQQPDTVTDRILINPPQPRHKTSKLIIMLMISNLIVVAGFFWFARKESGTLLPVNIQKTSMPEKIQVKPAIVPPIKMAPASKPVIKKFEPASGKAGPATQLLPTKPVVQKKSALDQLKPDQIKPEMSQNLLLRHR